MQFWGAVGLKKCTPLVRCDRVNGTVYAAMLKKHLPALRRGHPTMVFQQVTRYLTHLYAPHLCHSRIPNRSGAVVVAVLQWGYPITGQRHFARYGGCAFRTCGTQDQDGAVAGQEPGHEPDREHVGLMKTAVHRREPKTPQDLERVAKQEWHKLCSRPALVKSLFKSMKTRLELVAERKGGLCGY